MLAVIQFDSPSLAVLDRMLGAGRLPALAGLRERGVWHELETPATHFAAGAFHTLYSGMELADHGLFYPFQWSAADQRVRYMTDVPGPAAGVGAARPWAPHARGGPVREPPAADAAAGRAGLRLAAAPTGSCCSSGRAARAQRPRLETPVRPARSRSTRCSAAAPRRRDAAACAAPARLARPGRRRRRRCSWPSAVRPGVADVLRRPRRRPPVLGPVAARRRGRSTHAAPGARRHAGRRSTGVDAALRPRARPPCPRDADVIVMSPVGMDVNTSRAPTCCPRCSGRARPAPGRGRDADTPVPARSGSCGPRCPSGLRARVAPAPAGAGGARPHRAAGAARPGLDDDPRLRPPGREPGLRAAEPAGRERDGIVEPARGRGAHGRDRRRACARSRTSTARPPCGRSSGSADMFTPGAGPTCCPT